MKVRLHQNFTKTMIYLCLNQVKSKKITKLTPQQHLSSLQQNTDEVIKKEKFINDKTQSTM